MGAQEDADQIAQVIPFNHRTGSSEKPRSKKRVMKKNKKDVDDYYSNLSSIPENSRDGAASSVFQQQRNRTPDRARGGKW